MKKSVKPNASQAHPPEPQAATPPPQAYESESTHASASERIVSRPASMHRGPSGELESGPATCTAGESRRGFLRDSSFWLAAALPTASATSAAAHVNTTANTAPPTRPLNRASRLRVGLIGCGRSGTQLTAAILAAPQIQLVAMADVAPARIQQATRTLKGRFPDAFQVGSSDRFVGPSSYRDLLETDVDLVIVAVPYGMRGEVTAAALQREVHVYVEQPIAVAPSQLRPYLHVGDDGIASCNGAPTIGSSTAQLCIGNRIQLAASCGDAIEQIQQGAIGRIQSIYGDYRAGLGWPKALQKLTEFENEQSDENWVQRLVQGKRRWDHWQLLKSLSGDGTLKYRAGFVELCDRILASQNLASQNSAANPEVSMHGLATSSVNPREAFVESHVEYGSGGIDSRVRFAFPLSAPSSNHDRAHTTLAIPVVSRVRLSRDQKRPQDRIIVRGSDGWCDVLRGRFYNTDGTLRAKVAVSNVSRTAGIEHFVESLRSHDRDSTTVLANRQAVAINYARSALMAQTACVTCVGQTWSSTFHSHFAFPADEHRLG